MRASTQKLYNTVKAEIGNRDTFDPELAHFIDAIKHEIYHDYFSAHTFPIMALRNKALQLGLNKIAQMAVDGEFDATKEEADEWAASPDGQETFRLLIEGE